MKKMCIKILSVALCAVMMLGAAPLGGFVGLDLPQLFDLKAEAATYSGTCGSKLTWSLDTSTGVLNISGTGAMTNYTYLSYSSSPNTPWYSYSSYIKTVNIGNSVTTIGSYAFYWCNSLTSVTIPNSVTSIGSYAFEFCNSLTSVTIPDSVTSIGSAAFEFCDSLTSVTIPDSVTTIGNSAFAYCYSLTSVTIGNSVTTIGSYAFEGCGSLTSVTIGNSVKTIGRYAFYRCDNLKNTYYTGTPEQWKNVTIGNYNSPLTNNLIFECNSDKPYYIGVCGENLSWKLYTNGELIISGTGAMTDWTSSSNAPWYNQRSLITSVTIPNGVTHIGDYAFYDCTSLTSITIPDSVTSIGSYAFSNCDSLTSITIPDSVTSIGSYAFAYCDSLTNITVDANNKYYSSDSYGVLFNKDKTTLIQYPIENTRTNYTIPDSVTTIGNSAFYNCDSLTSVTIPNKVTTIGSSTFQYCSKLTSVTIPDSVTTIGDSAFYNCNSLTSITIPDSVTSIGNYAFYYCTNLKNTYYTGTLEQWKKVEIGNNNSNLTNNLIFECNSDKPCYDGGTCGENLSWKLYTNGELIISGTGAMTNWTSSSNAPWYKYRSKITSVTIPDGVTHIGDYAFYYCTSLTSITIPDSVTTIGDSAFSNCSSLANAYYKGNLADWCAIEFGNSYSSPASYAQKLYINSVLLEGKLEIPNGITSIGNFAFSNCDNLTNVTIPNSVTSIGNFAFYYCTSLAKITIPNSVTSIGKHAFGYCDGLTTVTLPSSITSLGEEVFYNCYDIEKVNYPGTFEDWRNISGSSENTSIKGDIVFKYNSSKPYYGGLCGESLTWRLYVDSTELTISGTGDMTDYTGFLISSAPWGNKSSKIKTVTISNGVTSIGSYAFMNLKSLINVKIADSVKSIGDYAFAGCNILININMPASLTTIGDSAFWCCYFITKVTLPNGVTKIDESAFNNCLTLSRISIPASVISIGKDAFEECSGLKNVYYGGSKDQWQEIAIYGGNEKLTSAKIHYNSTISDDSSTDNSYVPEIPYYDDSVLDEETVKSPSTTNISYGDSIILHVDPAKILEGGRVEWYPDNNNFSYSVSADGTTCTISPSTSGNTTFTTLIYDAEGKIISADTQTMTSKAGFFQKIIAFFKQIFGLTKVIPQ